MIRKGLKQRGTSYRTPAFLRLIHQFSPLPLLPLPIATATICDSGNPFPKVPILARLFGISPPHRHSHEGPAALTQAGLLQPEALEWPSRPRPTNVGDPISPHAIAEVKLATQVHTMSR